MSRIRCILLVLTLFLGVSVTSYAQKVVPPPPTDKRHKGPPCDPGIDPDETGPGVPPPPGLCLPIDDYVYLLMAVGVMYGCYKLRKFEIA